jgi:hypothetical protein
LRGGRFALCDAVTQPQWLTGFESARVVECQRRTHPAVVAHVKNRGVVRIDGVIDGAVKFEFNYERGAAVTMTKKTRKSGDGSMKMVY